MRCHWEVLMCWCACLAQAFSVPGRLMCWLTALYTCTLIYLYLTPPLGAVHSLDPTLVEQSPGFLIHCRHKGSFNPAIRDDVFLLPEAGLDACKKCRTHGRRLND